MQAIECYQFRRLSDSDPDFDVAVFFDIKYVTRKLCFRKDESAMRAI